MPEITSPTHSAPLSGASPGSQYTPSRSISRKTSTYDTPLSSSPHATMTQDTDHDTEADDEKLSALDPRRFTPTLHANLVSEILSLRRDVDGKNGLILGLEEQLVEAETETEQLKQTINGSAQETRDLRRRLQTLEGGSEDALNTLAIERDDAKKSLSELKKRVEAVQKKLKTRDDEVERINALWDSDRQHWDDQKRGLDRKVHIAESRMKSMTQELEAMQAQAYDHRPSFSESRPGSRGVPRPISRASGARSAMSHRREGSIESFDHNARFSIDDPLDKRPVAAAGYSLADELNLGSDEEEADEDGYALAEALPEEAVSKRPFSSQSNYESAKARKLLGLSMPENEDAYAPVEAKASPNNTRPRSDSRAAAIPAIREPHDHSQYCDVATQWSPPTSPTEATPYSLATIAEAESILERDSVYSIRQESTEGSSGFPTRASSPTAGLLGQKRVSMVSQAVQTLDQPPSPPATPQSAIKLPWAGPRPEMSSVSTQTDVLPSPPRPAHGTEKSRMEVPVISVRRPSTSNSNYDGVVLPPQTRNVGCQSDGLIGYESASVQTEDLASDSMYGARGFHSSGVVAVTEVGSPESTRSRPRRLSSDGSPTRRSLPAPRRRSTAGSKVSSLVKSFEYDRATRQLKEIDLAQRSRSQRSSKYDKMFEDFDGEHGEVKEDLDELDLGNLTDDSTASKEPIKRTLQRTESGWKSVLKPLDLTFSESEKISVQAGQVLIDPPLESPKLVIENEHGEMHEISTAFEIVEETPNSPEEPSRPPPPPPPPPMVVVDETSNLNRDEDAPAIGDQAQSKVDANALTASRMAKRNKEPDIRKMALISSGASAHMRRPRSPSAPTPMTNNDLSLDPPFPVPDRSSSKKLSWFDEPPSPTLGSVTFEGGGMYGRKQIRRPALKKVHSAESTHSSHGKSQKSSIIDPASSPPLSPSTFGLASVISDVPSKQSADSKLSKGDSVNGSAGQRYEISHHGSRASHHGSSTIASFHGSTLSESTSIVDAIAQTMVGEWLWKYVRRRKSFGMPEPASASAEYEFELGKTHANAAGSGGHPQQRHQRWVWLAPYERAVMWSSKQPTSGPALMGKSGRKLVIQSVLDVRDDTPMPKGADPASSFGRSILILTAQRALKFTAMNRERHYIWLTALSFLSHSSVIPQMLNPVAAGKTSEKAPPMPSREPPLPPPIAGGPISKSASMASLHQSKAHDSIRLATGRGNRPSLNPLSSSRRENTTPTSEGSSLQQPSGHVPASAILDGIDSADEAAEPPLVPRFAKHSRRRSNTGLGTVKSFKNFKAAARESAAINADANKSKVNNGYGMQSETNVSNHHSGGWATDAGDDQHGGFLGLGGRKSNRKGSRRWRGEKNGTASETVSPLAGPAENGTNFFEAIGTVRMEAFVQGLDEIPGESSEAKSKRAPRQRDSLQVLKERKADREKRSSRSARDREQKAKQVDEEDQNSRVLFDEKNLAAAEAARDARADASGNANAKPKRGFNKIPTSRYSSANAFSSGMTLPLVDAGDPFGSEF